MKAAVAKFSIVFKTSLKNQLAEKFDFAMHLAYLPMLAIILYYLWSIIFSSQKNTFGFSFNEIMAYVLVAVLLRRIIHNAWIASFVETEITEGGIIAYLCRPLNYFNYLLARRLSQTVLFSIIIIPLIAIIIFSMNLQFKALEFFLALLLTAVATAFTFTEFYCIGLLAFWLERIWGIKHAVDWVQEFLSGTLFPITFFPLIVQNALVFLPFKYLTFTPAMLFIGKASILDGLQGIAILGVWTIAFFLLGKLLWTKGLKKHDGKG